MDATKATTSTAQSATPQLALSLARHQAYRRLALTIIGLDVPSLTEQLRFRRELSGPRLRLIAPAARAA
jgi:hypothetical protein